VQVHLVFNASSGSGSDSDDVRQQLRALGAVIVDDPGEAERIVVWGGAPAAELALRHDIPLGVVPAGTANDFAAAAGLPDDPDAALELAVTGRETRPMELGRLDDRPFVNAASAGLAPAAAKRADPLKRLLGPVAYPAGALAAGLLDNPLKLAVDDHLADAASGYTQLLRRLLRGKKPLHGVSLTYHKS